MLKARGSVEYFDLGAITGVEALMGLRLGLRHEGPGIVRRWGMLQQSWRMTEAKRVRALIAAEGEDMVREMYRDHLAALEEARLEQLAALEHDGQPIPDHLREPTPLMRAVLTPEGQEALVELQRTVVGQVAVSLGDLTDPALIDGLVAASRAGVRIDLIVRGACTLRPGVAGETEHIHVRSVIGRFLEHTRVFHFRWGDGPRQQALYLSSADWMTRNMLRRVEIAWPVDDPALHQRVLEECLEPYLRDGVDAWELQSDGQYLPAAGEGPAAQRILMGLLGRAGHA